MAAPFLPTCLALRTHGVRAAAVLALVAAALHTPAAQAVAVDASPQQTTPAAAASRPAGVRVAQAPPVRRADTRPSWGDLTAEQKQALQPLAGTWGSISEAQKRKWIALSRNFGQMKPDEQGKLHSRMNEWVALSPQQRAQARLNFGETKDLAADDKRAKWEAYQALSPEEKRKLAAGAAPKTPPTATAVRPVPAQKLANVPRSSSRDSKPPRIATGPAAEATSTPNASPAASQAN